MENSGLSPDAVVSGDGEGQKPNDGDGGPLPRKPGSKAEGRKRTKTGCLTCRRRRIKCGEERPNCQNCRKSKRHCEGYNQRVVFKDPLNAYRGPQLSASSQVAPSESLCIPPVSHQGETHRQSSTGQTPLPIIAPKPAQPLGYSMKGAVVARISALPMTAPVAEARMDSIPNGVTTDYPTTQKGLQTKSGTTVDRDLDPLNCSHIAEPSPFQQMQASKLHFNPVTEHEAGKVVPKLLASSTMLDWSAGPSTASTSSSQELFYDSNSLLPVSGPFYQSYQRTSNFTQALTSLTPITATFPAQGSESAILHKQLEDLPGASETAKHRHIGCTQPQQRGPQWDPPPTTTGPVDPDPARQYRPVEHFSQFDMSDDDSNMEEQDGSDSNVEDDHLENNDLGIVVALQARQDTQDLRLRSFTSFINRPDMLVMYVPSPGSSPLRDSMTARIFCHFINVTGPSISLSERHPANPSLIFQGQPVPKSQQHIWTYTFPTLALQNPALLHAMLAIASLQIANLQNGSVTASLKHYAISLRKVAKSVSLPTRRGQPATLAAALLLAAYECWCADHQKWSNHLLGAKQLVREINFAEMTRYVKSVKLQQRREERMSSHHVQHEYGHEFYDEKTRHRTYVDDVDENIVSILMGNKLRYDQYGHILDDKLPDSRGSKLYTQRDLDIYETQRDLFWWYCKQDVLQSILGGGRLFMEYTLWSHCPPRAPLGRLNATYGTYDHLVLLMGRLADFSFRDLRRKKLCMKANGGHWRPPRSMRIQTQLCHIQNQQGRPQQVPSTSQQPPQIPGFSGMMPSVGEATLPMGFTASKDDYSPGSHRDDIDLGAMTLEAEEEWQEIRNTFSILEDHFGEDFQALDPEFSTPIQTPFGTALQYRTYGIACIWMNYYMALIACYRAHPSMPPAAMAAAGIASRQTASFANELGRIAAGLTPDSNLMQVSPGVGGALMESSTCLFVASVQYQNAAQRNWTVSRLQDITRLTGWQTAMAILNGCETAWVRASEMGNGPPYTRTSEPGVVPKTWSSSRRLGNALADLSKDERLTIKGSDRVHYALGILGVQEDLQKLDLDPDEVSIQGS